MTFLRKLWYNALPFGEGGPSKTVGEVRFDAVAFAFGTPEFMSDDAQSRDRFWFLAGKAF